MGHYDDQYEEAQKQEIERAELLDQLARGEALRTLDVALAAARKVPASRDISIAITHIETAILWLKK
jgi:hypothetical protein